MLEFIAELGMFILKTAVIVLGVVAVISALGSGVSKRQKVGPAGRIDIRNINEELEGIRNGVAGAVMSQAEFKHRIKQHKKERKKKEKEARKRLKARDKDDSSEGKSTEATTSTPEEPSGEQPDDAATTQAVVESTIEAPDRKKKLFVLDFVGDIAATRVENLRHEITAVVTMAAEGDSALVRVESQGGMVANYGFAASQLTRIKEAGIHLTVSIDRVAASGGYMVAVVADHIIAAPFATVGSIGVVAEVPNVNRLLKKFDVDYDVYTAGQYKRTVSVMGENTEEGKEKFKEELNLVHEQFQDFVQDNRSSVDAAAVATGEAWSAQRALKLNLVDELMTSDQFILKSCDASQVYHVKWEGPKRPLEELVIRFMHVLSRPFHWLRRKDF